MNSTINKNKVLYISYDGMTDPLGQSQVLPYLSGLSKKGFHIHLVSAEKKERLKNRALIQEICDKYNILWHPIAYTKKPPILSTLWDLFKIWKLALVLHKKNNFNLIHCRSYISAFIGLYFKKKLNVPFIFDMRGFWADERIEGNIWNINKSIYKYIYNYFKSKEKEFLFHADHTIALTEKAKAIIIKAIIKKEIPITVIPCCADLEHFNKKNIDTSLLKKFKQKHAIENTDKLIGYVGSLGTWYLSKEMLATFKIIHQQDPYYKFLILTLDDPNIILDEAKNQNIPTDKIIITSASRNELPTLLSLLNYSIYFIKPSFSKQASSPTKQGELMGMGIPVITNAGVGDSDEIIKKYNSGIVLNLENMNDKIELLDFNKEEIEQNAEQCYSLAKGIALYEKVYLSVIKK